MKRFFAIFLTMILLMGCLSGCSEKKAQLLSFSQAQSVAEMEKLDGKQVTIIGYMSTLSPVSGKFMYLMNLPYQNCPFCVPNTTQLSNTMAVYAPEGKEFAFTDRAIQVTGTLEFGDWTDEFGYEYSYRIKDAAYTEVDTSNMDPKLQLWQQLASTDVISQVYAMFEYVNFLCLWPTYTAEFAQGQDYLYPDDALMFLEEGDQFGYGRQDGYFEDMLATIESVDPDAFEELEQIIRSAQQLADQAYGELAAGNCTQVQEYSGAFGDGRFQFRLDQQESLEQEMANMYYSFSAWLSSWEL